MDWYDPKTGESVAFHRLVENETIAVDSFTNHTFVLRFDNDTCADRECRSTVVVVNDCDDQVVKVKEGLVLEQKDSSSIPSKPKSTTSQSRANQSSSTAADIVQQCRQAAKVRIEKDFDGQQVIQTVLTCIEEATAHKIEKVRKEELFETQLREKVAGLVESYTCSDNNLESSKASEVRTWENKNITHQVHLFHERQASKIHMLENFISPVECAAIQKAAEPILHHGTVADGKGGHRLSDHRKAMQAGVRVPWEREEQDDPIARVMRRIYAYTNHATGLGIEVEGQEDLMSIQYFGRGEEDKAPDRYMPHCDGDCTGLPHKLGGRVATMVMYCDAEGLVGGGTNFGHAGIFVRPKVGAAAFFSYLDAATHIHETGFTTHSGCPVVEGTKRIAVHWMRVGVNKDMPWNSFDTNNIQKGDCDDDE